PGKRIWNHVILNHFSRGKSWVSPEFLAFSFGHSFNTQIGLIATDDQNFLHSCTNSCTRIEFPVAQYRNRAQRQRTKTPRFQHKFRLSSLVATLYNLVNL